MKGCVFSAHLLSFPLILLQCKYRKVLARLKALLLLLDCWPIGHLLSGASKQVTEQQEKSPQSWENMLPLLLLFRGEIHHQAAVVCMWAYGWAWCGPDFTRVPLMSQQLLLPLAHHPCPIALAHPGILTTICCVVRAAFTSPAVRCRVWGRGRAILFWYKITCWHCSPPK